MKLSDKQVEAIALQISALFADDYAKHNAEVQRRHAETYEKLLAERPALREYLVFCNHGRDTNLVNGTYNLKAFFFTKHANEFRDIPKEKVLEELRNMIRREAVIYSSEARNIDDLLARLTAKYI